MREHISENSAWETRVTLLQRAKDPTDEEAWEEFVRYYEDFIRIVVRKTNLPENEASDVAQIVLVKIWKNLATFEIDKNRARFRTWLTTIVRNTIFNYTDKDVRRTKRHQDLAAEHSLNAEDGSWPSAPEFDELIRREWENYITNMAMENIRHLFSDRALTAFSLSLDGMEIGEVAKRLGIKENSAYKLRNRVKARLVAEIQRLRRDLEL